MRAPRPAAGLRQGPPHGRRHGARLAPGPGRRDSPPAQLAVGAQARRGRLRRGVAGPPRQERRAARVQVLLRARPAARPAARSHPVPPAQGGARATRRHRPHPRLELRRGAVLRRGRVLRGWQPGRLGGDPSGRPHGGAAGDPSRAGGPGGRGPRRRPLGRRPPQGREARQHPGRRRPGGPAAGASDRLRHRHGDRPVALVVARGHRPRLHRHRPRRRTRQRHLPLHGAGAARGSAGHRPGRRLRARRGVLPDDRRPARPGDGAGLGARGRRRGPGRRHRGDGRRRARAALGRRRRAGPPPAQPRAAPRRSAP